MKPVYKFHLEPLLTLTVISVYRIEVPGNIFEKINIFNRFFVNQVRIYKTACYHEEVANEIMKIKQNLPQMIAEYELERHLIETRKEIIKRALSEVYTPEYKNRGSVK
jgi:hypothetical protein